MHGAGRMKPIAITIALGACASSYTPAHHAGISVIQRHGDPAYVRDDRVYAGLFGLEQAVDGNTEAERLARSARRRRQLGFPLAYLGLGCALGGSLAIAHDVGSRERAGSGMIAATVGCSASALVGALLLSRANAQRWDAVNIYNAAYPAR